MSLRVHNFYTKDRLSTNKYHNIVMQNCDFYILVSNGGKFRELALQVPKKFHYERHVSYGSYEIQKADEYNVLIDYMKNNREGIISKWHLGEGEYEVLLNELKICLIKNYSICGDLERFIKIIILRCTRFIHGVITRRVQG